MFINNILIFQTSDANIPISEAIGQGLKHAGVSVTITTLTDVFAIAIGSISVSIINRYIITWMLHQICMSSDARSWLK